MDGETKWSTPLEQRMQQADGKLSARRKRLLLSILENAEDTYYLSSRKMARRYGVDAATIVRTIQVLGYSGFSAFLSDLRSHFVTRITQYRVMKSTVRKYPVVDEHVRHSLEMDRANLEALGESVSPARIVELARPAHLTRTGFVERVDIEAS